MTRHHFSAYIEDVAISDLPKETRATIENFLTVKKGAKVVQYGMVVKELVGKADVANLKTARAHLKEAKPEGLRSEVEKRVRDGSKFILLLNDRIIDGHHFLAKAEKAGVTSSLPVLDLTPARFQLGRRLQATVELSRDPYRKDGERFRNVAVGTGAAVAGGGVAYAGIRAARAADEVARTAKNATAISGAVVKTGKRFVRSSQFIKRQLRKVAQVKLFSFEEKKKRHLSPALGAAASGAASGALLGALPLLRRGTKLRTALKSIGGTAAASAGIVGGGTVIGSKILGDPKKDEGAAFTKRAAVGGGIAGATAGLAAGVLATKTRGGRKLLRAASKTWRPAAIARRGGLPGAVAVGTLAGGAVGAAQGADEGQQVDGILNLRKDMKKKTHFSRRISATIEFAVIGHEGGVPLTGKVARDRYVKKIRDEDLDRRDANILRAGVAGAAVGLLTRGKLNAARRAAVGAGAGAAAVVGVRKATENSRDPYGERSRGAKRAEAVPLVAGAVGAGALALRRLRVKKFEGVGDPIILSRLEATILFGKKDQPRFGDTKQYADPLRAYGENASLVDAAGNATRLTQSQLVNAAWRGGREIRKTARRGSNLLRDVSDVASGRPKQGGRKREWEKEWFRNSVLTAGGAGALLTHAVLRRKVPKYRAKSDAIEGAVKKKVQGIRAKVDGGLGLSARPEREIFFARLEATLLFDALAADAGWDVRDARGKSARVFSPGSRRRQRRPAEWHEKKDGQRKILGTLAAAGTAAGLVTGLVIGRRSGRVKVVNAAPKAWQKPGYRSKKVSVVSRKAFREAGEATA